jgi:hypothetical protein
MNHTTVIVHYRPFEMEKIIEGTEENGTFRRDLRFAKPISLEGAIRRNGHFLVEVDDPAEFCHWTSEAEWVQMWYNRMGKVTHAVYDVFG